LITKNRSGAARAAACCALASLLACCGGGGSGDGGTTNDAPLAPTVTLNQAARILQPSTLHLAISGLNGHTATCFLAPGRPLPQGLALNTDCSITGTAAQLGVFPVDVDIHVLGSTGVFIDAMSVVVAGPPAEYTFRHFYTLGDALDVSPGYDASFAEGWTPPPGMTVSYAVDAGALPAGVQLDPVTGRVHGTIASTGVFEVTIGSHVSFSGQGAAESLRYWIESDPVTLAYSS